MYIYIDLFHYQDLVGLSESPGLSTSTGSSSGFIAFLLAIDLSACFVSFTTGGSPSNRAAGFGDRLSMIVRSRATEVVLSKEAKYRLHLSRISSIRRSYLSSSLMY